MLNKVVTRFPPSPTGPLHIGRVRTMLFTYLFTRQNEGKTVLRFEDTDPARSKREFEGQIIKSLNWLGLTYDDGPYRQMDRVIVYRKYLEDLIEKGIAYISKEEVLEDNHRPEVVRFKNPNRVVTFQDLLRGEISFDTTDLGDFIIARGLDEPLYHFTVVVDDHEMGITHVTRGEEHISNTPRQILIQEAIGATRPVYIHMPLILAPDKSKLSARHGAKPVLEYKADGYLPDAIINFLALLGWHPVDDKEVFTRAELLQIFDITRVQKAGAIFDITKLNWLNREHMKFLTSEELARLALPYLPSQEYSKYLPLLLERIDKFGDIRIMLADGGEFDFLTHRPKITKDLLVGKSGASIAEIKQHLEYIVNNGTSRELLWPYAEQVGKSKVLWPMRVALSGKEMSPDQFTLVKYLGEKESISRLKIALNALNEK